MSSVPTVSDTPPADHPPSPNPPTEFPPPKQPWWKNPTWWAAILTAVRLARDLIESFSKK